MAKAQSVIDVMLGEGGGKTPAERYADYLAIASVVANRAQQLGVTPEEVVQRQSEFNAYNKRLPAGVDKYRGLAERAIAEVAQNGPVHKATFYATPASVKNLPRGLNEEVRTGSHIYKSDPQNRAIFTSVGLKSPSMAYAQEPSAQSPFDALIGPVTNSAGDQLIGRVPGSKPAYRDPLVSAPNYKGTGAAVEAISEPAQMFTTTKAPNGRLSGSRIGVGTGGMAGERAVIAGPQKFAGVSPGFQAPERTGIVTRAPLNAPGVAYTAPQQAQIQQAAKASVADALTMQKAALAAARPAQSATYSGVPGVSIGVNSLDGTTPTYSVNTPKMGTPLNPSALPAPTRSITPVQAVPGVGDTLIGPVSSPKAKDWAAAQSALPGDTARGTVGRIGGSLVGGILAGPLGGIIGGMLGNYAGKTGFRDAPLSINNIGSGANNVYGVYAGAPRGTQATANNGGLVTSLGNGKTAYTNKMGATTVTDAAGNNMADWSGRSYGNASKSSKK